MKNIFVWVRDFRKVLGIVVLHYNLGQLSRTLQDFEDYLKMSPEASDAGDIRQVTVAIRRNLAAMN